MSRRQTVFSGTLFLALLAIAPVAMAQNFATLFNFPGGPNGYNGYPSGPPAIAGDGVLYGATSSGTVYALTPPATPAGAWSEQVLYTFTGGSDGLYPSPLIIGAGGVLYGATEYGGSFGGAPCQGVNCGTVFSLTPPSSPGASWTKTIIYNFMGGGDGAFPLGPLAIGSGGVLYGTTSMGGSATGPVARAGFGCGTVFSLGPAFLLPGGAWTESVLYTFTTNETGTHPHAGVVIGKDGVLYGTTEEAGPGVCGSCGGTVFALYPPASAGAGWAKRTLPTFPKLTGRRLGLSHLSPSVAEASFMAPPAWEAIFAAVSIPVAPSSVDSARTRRRAGSRLSCTPFRTTLPSPTTPSSHLAATWRVLYGTTEAGGGDTTSPCPSYGCGSVFMLTPPASPGGAWTHTVQHSFAGPPNQGNEPNSGVAIGPNGALYGVTDLGGASNAGTLFTLMP